ncbi:MAG: peptidase M16 [Planctomycetaceae bacterium]|nr:MAG: peptidase M16 [Planctomycetaceae bacterium]
MPSVSGLRRWLPVCLGQFLGWSVVWCWIQTLSAQVGPMKIVTVEGITEYRLNNGLQVLLFPDPSKPTVTVNLTVFVGSRHEGYGEGGMAHLLEHMLFKGTPDHPHIPKALQERGANFNGTTWLDRTNYYETLPATAENLEFAIRLEADRLVNSLIREEDLRSEMTVVRNEFEEGENDPQSILLQRMMSAAFEWHNYGKATIGNRADIERVPIEALRQFYRKYYQPDNALLIVAGKFDEQQALEFIGRYFGTLPRPQRELPNTWTEEPAQDGERLVTLRRVGEVAMVGVLYHIPAGAHPDFVPVDVLATLLTMQPAGRLYKSLVESRKAASVHSAAYALHDPGVMRILAEVTSGNSPENVLETLLDTLEEVVEAGVRQDEVDRARQRLLKHWELLFSDSADLAIELSEWAAMGDWRLFFLYRDRLEQVRVDDVNRVARSYLSPANRTVGLFIPTTQTARTVIPPTPPLEELVGNYRGRQEVDVGEELDVDPRNIESRTIRTTIEGVKVALLPKKTRGNTVVVRLTLRYGDEESLVGYDTAADLLPLLMTRGTRQLTRQQIQDSLDQNLASWSASGNVAEAEFTVLTKRKHLPAVLDLLRQVLREPSLPDTEFELLRQQRRTDLEQALTDTQEQAVNRVRRAINPFPPADVRYIPTLEEELQRLQRLDIAQVRKLYQQFLGAQAGELVVVGDFSPDEVLAIFQKTFQGWTARMPYRRIVMPGEVSLKAQVERIQIPDKANTFYLGATVFPLIDTHPDYAPLTLANYIFGAGALSSRLGDRIRQKEGLSYGVGSMLRDSSVDPRTVFMIYAIANPANVERVHRGIREELERMRREPPTAEEVERARQGLLQMQKVSLTDDLKLASILKNTLYAGRTMEYYARLEEQLSQVSPEHVQRVFARYIDPERLFIAIAGDFALESPSPSESR